MSQLWTIKYNVLDVNVAKNKPAMQSSTYSGGGEPTRAVDGNMYVFKSIAITIFI